MEGDDKRIDFLQDVTLKAFKIKADKWLKFIAGEDNRTFIASFFDKADFPSLVISLNAASQLVSSLSFPQTIKTKAVYFTKRDQGVITKDNIKQVFVGDVSNSPVDVVIGVTEEVSLP